MHYKILQKDIKKGLIYGVYHTQEHKYILRIQFIFMNGNKKIAILSKAINRSNAKPIKIPIGFGQRAGKLIV